MPATKVRRKPRIRRMKFKDFDGKELELRLRSNCGHDDVELWKGKVRLCHMHIANNFVHIFREGKLKNTDAFVNLNSTRVSHD